MSRPDQRYVALLRAINVGGHNVKMADLRVLFEQLELASVETFIASGNVIFTAPEADTAELEARIAEHLKAALGYAVATFIRTPAELAAVSAYLPFSQAELDGSVALSVGFMAAAPAEAAQAKVLALRTDLDDFHLHGRELYWLHRARQSESKISGGVLEKALGAQTTLRNITTVRKLAAKYG